MLKEASVTVAKLVMERFEEDQDIMFAVGSGQAVWDDFNPPTFDVNRKILYNETYRSPVFSVSYVDPTTFEVSDEPTRCLKVVGHIPETSSIDGTYIREKAVFIGGEAANQGSILHAESTALETKVENKESTTEFYITF